MTRHYISVSGLITSYNFFWYGISKQSETPQILKLQPYTSTLTHHVLKATEYNTYLY